MTFKRIKAISKLLLLFGTPLAVVLGLFGSGVYYGVKHQARIATFEREWLGLDVEVVPTDPAPAVPMQTELEGGAPAGDPAAIEADRVRGEGGGPEREGSAEQGRAPSEVLRPADDQDEKDRGARDPFAVPPGPSDVTPSGGEQVQDDRPASPLAVDEPSTRLDPLSDELAHRLALPVVVHVKVLVDEALIEQRADWIDYVQRTVSQASQIYEKQFGVELELSAVARWPVATAGMSSTALLEDLEQRPREGADILVGFTERPFDDRTAGRAQSPTPDDPFNGAYGVVYATQRHRNPHLRTLLHEIGHMFGALDVTDPEDPAFIAGSFMSYAVVPESQAPWIDPANRERVLARKDRAFRPEREGDDEP